MIQVDTRFDASTYAGSGSYLCISSIAIAIHGWNCTSSLRRASTYVPSGSLIAISRLNQPSASSMPRLNAVR